MGGVDDRLSHFPIQSRQADIEPSPQDIATIGESEIDLRINCPIGRQRYFDFGSGDSHRSDEARGPARGEQLSGLVPFPAAPGDDNVTSKRPSELRDAPSRPPVV
jgi:hypothetical protein